MYILDTSIIIAFLRNKPMALNMISDLNDKVFTTDITIGELHVGIQLASPQFQKVQRKYIETFIKNLNGIFHTDNNVAMEYGKIKARLRKLGLLIGDNDTWIAATCLAREATLVTLNKKHFECVAGLSLL